MKPIYTLLLQLKFLFIFHLYEFFRFTNNPHSFPGTGKYNNTQKTLPKSLFLLLFMYNFCGNDLYMVYTTLNIMMQSLLLYHLHKPGASSQGVCGGKCLHFWAGGIFFLIKGGKGECVNKSKITRGKLHSGSNRNRAGKLLQLPPLEFTGLHRLPPLEIGPENSFNYPPRIHGTSDFIDYPPSKSGRKTPQLPPSNFGIDGSSSPATFKVWLRPRGECLHDPGGIDAPATNLT